MNRQRQLLGLLVACVLLSPVSQRAQNETSSPPAEPEWSIGLEDLPVPSDEELARQGITFEQWQGITNALGHIEAQARKGLPRDQVDLLLSELLEAELPPDATNIWCFAGRLFTHVTKLRFGTTPEGLAIFLASTPRLPAELTPGLRTLEADPSYSRPQWRPYELGDYSGCNVNWRTHSGTNSLSCCLMAGTPGDGKGVDVYLMIVWEIMHKRE